MSDTDSELKLIMRERLNHSQRAAIPMLVAGRSRDEVAEALGVSPLTVRDWMAPGHKVREAVDCAVVGAIAEARANVASVTHELIQGLYFMATDANLQARDRIAATKELLKVLGLGGGETPSVTINVEGGEKREIWSTDKRDRLAELRAKRNPGGD